MPVTLPGLSGLNPLDFLAALGTLRILDEGADQSQKPRLAWESGSWNPILHGPETLDAVVDTIAADCSRWRDAPVLQFAYPKVEKGGAKSFRGLRAPIASWRAWLASSVESGERSSLDLFAALASESAVDQIPDAKRPSQDDFAAVGSPFDPAAPQDQSTQPTAFDFTSRNAQFRDQVRLILKVVDAASLRAGFRGETSPAESFDRTMNWDPSADQPAALYSYGRQTNPALEWLAFRGLAFFPVLCRNGRPVTTACRGRRKDGRFVWPLWEPRCTTNVLRSLVAYPSLEEMGPKEKQVLGISQVVEAGLTKAADGYTGVFSPSRIV